MLPVRHALAALTVLIAALLGAGAAEPLPGDLPMADNQLTNQGFEEPDAATGLPAPWAGVYGDAQTRWTLDEGTFHSGRRSLRIDFPTVPAKDQAASVEQTISVRPGLAYYCSAWYKGQPVGAEGMIFIVWKTRDGGWHSVSGSRFTYSGDWQQAVVSGRVPAGAFTGTARVDIRSPGVAWIDDLEMGCLVPVTWTLSLGDGIARTGTEIPFTASAADRWGNPVPGAAAEFRLETNGDAGLRDTVGADAALVRALPGRTDERGQVHGVLRMSREAGKRDVLRCVAPGFPAEKSPVAAITTATAGQPTAYRVELADEFPRVGAAAVTVSVQRVGRYGEALPSAAERPLRWQVEGDGRLATAETALGPDGTSTNTLTPGAALAKVTVAVADQDGIRGVSATLTVVPEQRPDSIRMGSNGYFIDGAGRPFVPLGGVYANFVHAVTDGHVGPQISTSFSEVSDAQLRDWFAYLADNGFTALRGMLRDHTKKGCEPLDIIGQANLNLLERWQHMLALAQPYGIRFQLTLHESWYATYAAYQNAECLEKTVLPYYAGQDLATLPAYRQRFLVERRMVRQTADMMSDTDALACQRDYLRDVMPRLVAIPGIFAYEIENEQSNGFLEWTAAQLRGVRQVDRLTPLCVSPLGMMSVDAASWTRALDIDFYSPHAYSSGKGIELALEVLVGAKYTRLFKPSFTGEAEGFSDGYKHAPVLNQMLGVRDTIWFQLLSGSPGCFIWYSDSDAVYAEFRLPKEIMGTLDLAHRRWAKAPIGIDVSHETADDAYFATDDGKAMQAALGQYAERCLARGVAFDYTFNNADYSVRLPGRSFVEPPPLLGPLGLPPQGLHVQYLVSDDNACVFAYVRNQAGLKEVSGLGYEKAATALLRTRTPLTAALELNLPFAAGEATVWDLDTRAKSVHPVMRHSALPLAGTPTDHDFVVIIRRT
jgi:hypothetical protein